MERRALPEDDGATGVKPDNVLHIGDNAKIDVEAAKKAGLHALLLPRPADVFMDADCTQMTNLGHGCLAGFTTADAMQPAGAQVRTRAGGKPLL